MIKVLHIVGKMDMAGLETLMMTFYRNIDRSKIQFHFVSLSGQKGFYDDEIIALGGKVLYPPEAYNWKNPLIFKKWFEGIVSTKEYDILHSHNGGAANIVFAIAKKYGMRTIIHSHHASTKKDTRIKSFGRKISKTLAFRNVDLFLACSNEAGKFMFGNRQFTVLNNAINVNKFVFNEDVRIKIRNQLNLNGKFVIGAIGRLTQQKNPYGLLDIFENTLSTNPACVLLWIGKGELEREIKEKIKEKDLQDNVIMLGAVDNVFEIVQAMDLFILPSFFEGLGIVAVEAQASGLPTICSNTVPKLAAVTSLCDFEDIEDIQAWTHKITQYIKNPIVRENTSAQIRDSGFDIIEEASKLTKIYERIYNRGDK